jgi:hypothetical protein
MLSQTKIKFVRTSRNFIGGNGEKIEYQKIYVEIADPEKDMIYGFQSTKVTLYQTLEFDLQLLV